MEKPARQPRQTPREKASAQAEAGTRIAATLDDATLKHLPEDYELLLIQAERLRLCNRSDNQFAAKDLNNGAELFDGFGRFWHCNSRLCPGCVSALGRRHRRQIKFAIDKQKPLVGTDYRFITFTMPNPGIGLTETREILNYAWRRFTKRRWFNKTFVGCAKSEEFTVTSQGFHYHLHLLALTSYMDYNRIRTTWTDCVTTAFRAAGLPCEINTIDKLAIVNVQKIHDMKASINELCKYITKSNSWEKLDTATLLDVVRLDAFPRSFEVLGSFRVSDDEKVTLEGVLGRENKTILDTSDANAAVEEPTDWKGHVKLLGAALYVEGLYYIFDKTRTFRKFHLHRQFRHATFRALSKPKSTAITDFLTKLDRAAAGRSAAVK